MMKRLLPLSITAVMLIYAFPAYAEVKLETDKQKLSYAMGAYFSQGIKQQSTDVDIDVFLQAVEDVLKDKQLKLSTDEIEQALTRYQQELQKKMAASASDNLAKGKAFLAENKKKDGVVELESGLQYKVLKSGNGKKPGKDSSVKVHYHGTLLDGEVFDSSYDRGEPIVLSLDRVIKGWQEALQLMPVGSKWQVYIPSDLAYGERGAGGAIGPNETLLFDIELISIE